VTAALVTDKASAHRVADLAAESIDADEAAVSLTEENADRWRVTVYFRAEPDEAILRALVEAAAGAAAARQVVFSEVAAKDWVGESLAGLKPVAAGRFVVHGAHDRGKVAPNRIGIEIEAALAFGTGHHGTTRGCLLALDLASKWRPRPQRLLDLGTGTGVLAIAAARRWRRAVLATDLDAASVRAARDNARLNEAAAFVTVIRADGLKAQAVRARAPFDLAFANILLEPLRRLGTPLSKSIAPGGTLILSGLLAAQANAALSAYRTLKLERRIVLDGWTTLVLRRPRHRAPER
jgi:ribosomal protein L11 methyltransferase